MREILFRVKRLDTGEWVEGNLWLYGKKARIAVDLGFPQELSWIEVDPDTVGQFTGLVDKHGKKIFEGDIVEYNDGFDYFKGCVVFENGSFGVGSYEVIGLSSGCCDNFVNLWQLFWDQEANDEPELYYCTVIGNIHDNQEPLKEGEGNG